MKLIAEREIEDHEEVELLLEGYRSDLQEMQIELRSMRGQIDDTREFINTHQVNCLSFFYWKVNYFDHHIFRNLYIGIT